LFGVSTGIITNADLLAGGSSHTCKDITLQRDNEGDGIADDADPDKDDQLPFNPTNPGILIPTIDLLL
jgi:hypothetical protein